MKLWRGVVIGLAVVGGLDLAIALAREASEFPARVRFAVSEAEAGRSPFAFDMV